MQSVWLYFFFLFKYMLEFSWVVSCVLASGSQILLCVARQQEMACRFVDLLWQLAFVPAGPQSTACRPASCSSRDLKPFHRVIAFVLHSHNLMLTGAPVHVTYNTRCVIIHNGHQSSTLNLLRHIQLTMQSCKVQDGA